MASLAPCYRGTMRRIQRSQGRMVVRTASIVGRPRDVWVMPLLVEKSQRVRYRQLSKTMHAF